MINFPLYPVRQYLEIFTEGKFSIIQTARSRYVLDFAEPDCSSTFGQRRVRLLVENLPYDIYPLKGKIDDVTTLISSTKTRTFIDCKGTITTWKPTKSHRILCFPILYREVTADGNMLLKVQGFNSLFKCEPTIMSYVQIVKFRGVNVIFGFSDKMEKPTRKKL